MKSRTRWWTLNRSFIHAQRFIIEHDVKSVLLITTLRTMELLRLWQCSRPGLRWEMECHEDTFFCVIFGCEDDSLLFLKWSLSGKGRCFRAVGCLIILLPYCICLYYDSRFVASKWIKWSRFHLSVYYDRNGGKICKQIALPDTVDEPKTNDDGRPIITTTQLIYTIFTCNLQISDHIKWRLKAVLLSGISGLDEVGPVTDVLINRCDIWGVTWF